MPEARAEQDRAEPERAAEAPELVLLHSPLVGASTWRPVAEVLRSRGRAVLLPSLADAFAGPGPYYPRLVSAAADAIAAGAGRGPLVLVGHSGAGALLPAVAGAVGGGRVVRTVFADALLPHPGRSWFSTVPAELSTRLRGLARGGLLPPWDEWFPPGTVEELLPEPGQRARFRAELPRLPLAYFEEAAPAAEDAPPRCGVYVQWSEGYAAEAHQAEQYGRPVIRRSAHHLAMLTEPRETAAVLEEAVGALAL